MLLSLTGLSGSGKDTVGKFLQDNYGFVIVSWASDLRRYLAKKFSDAPAHYHRSSGFIEPDKEWELSSGFQQGLINISNEVRLQCFCSTLTEIKRLLAQGKKVVVVSTRMPAELASLKHLGGTIARVIRDNPSRETQPLDRLLEEFDFDLVIQNNGTVQDLENFLRNEFGVKLNKIDRELLEVF